MRAPVALQLPPRHFPVSHLSYFTDLISPAYYIQSISEGNGGKDGHQEMIFLIRRWQRGFIIKVGVVSLAVFESCVQSRQQGL